MIQTRTSLVVVTVTFNLAALLRLLSSAYQPLHRLLCHLVAAMPAAKSSSSPIRSPRARRTFKAESSPLTEQDDESPAPTTVTPKKRSSRTRGVKKEEDDDDVKVEDEPAIDFKRARRAKQEDVKSEGAAMDVVSPSKPSSQLAKKLKQLEMHRQTPFPSYARPTAADCKYVLDALASVHGGVPARPLKLEDRPNAAAGCGQVPNVIDALVRTILSQNTTSKVRITASLYDNDVYEPLAQNSTAAKKSMDAMFGYGDYEAVRVGKVEDLATALAPGGLANIKAKVIKKVLDSVYERNGGCVCGCPLLRWAHKGPCTVNR
jgi:endonuclease III